MTYTSASPAHILLVEDSETQALKFQLLLEDSGYQVSRVASAEAGLEFLNQQIPDLVVVDYFLPGMQGDAFCRMVRIKAQTKTLPLLVLTEVESDAPKLWLLDSGASDYLSKSESFEILHERISGLLRKRRHRQWD